MLSSSPTRPSTPFDGSGDPSLPRPRRPRRRVISRTGAPAFLLGSWRRGGFDLIVFPTLVDKLRRVFAYPRIRQRISEEEAARLLESFALAAVQVDDPDDVPPVCRDPNDDYLFALADVYADVLVSGDRDILEATDPGVRVLTPAGFDEILRRRWN